MEGAIHKQPLVNPVLTERTRQLCHDGASLTFK